MKIIKFQEKTDMSKVAAIEGAAAINKAITARGFATIVLATGASQFEMLEQLIKEDIDWSRVSGFHMDEYVGLAISHKASFRKYLQEHLLDHLPAFKNFEFVEGDADDVAAEVSRLNELLDGINVDVCFGGIGENCHLAFNDPPADFDIQCSYHVVELDEACRRQQMGEGWFATLDDVPKKAISMTIHRIITCEKVIICAPDARKADAAKHAIEGPVTENYPASILQNHNNTSFYLDAASASLLEK